MGAQAVANEGGSTVALTDSMKQALMDRVESYGNHHTLCCLALASRPMPSSNDPVLPASHHICLVQCLAETLQILLVAPSGPGSHYRFSPAQPLPSLGDAQTEQYDHLNMRQNIGWL